MTELTTRLRDAIGEIEVPERDLVHDVLAKLPDPAARTRQTLLLAAGFVAAIVVALTATLAPARTAVAGWLGIGATEVIELRNVDLPDATSVEELGEPSDPASSEHADPIPSLGVPEATFDDAERGRSYTWAANDQLPAIGDTTIGLVLSVRPSDRVLGAKFVDGAIEQVQISTWMGPATGLWIDGQHALVQIDSERAVTADRVLLWAIDEVEYRIESALPLEQVVSIAEDVTGGTNLLAPG